jgi:predicted ABC-class ATPase
MGRMADRSSKEPHDLKRTLERIDGRGYKAYRDIEGAYGFPAFTLSVDHVQADPFAAPSRLSARVRHDRAGFPPETLSSRSRRTGLADYLLRRFDSLCRSAGRRAGSGKSGLVGIDGPGQEIIERTALIVDGEGIEARFHVGLPASGRRILAREAHRILLEVVPRIASESLFYAPLQAAVRAVLSHAETNEDADFLRGAIRSAGLVAFVADGAVLPRRSGVDDRPMPADRAVVFESPPALRVGFDLPNRGPVTGMGIPTGVTLIVGGGYHGKSTLLNAVERGIYNHIPGDGRELVITDPGAIKIRAEDGRRVERVDISPFISNLPFGEDTRSFSTQNASGSTSQAANIMEALEAGATVILTDEDTAATNFMIRDHRMQELIAKDKEPITPFLDRVRQLDTDLGVSTILVMGGSGDYFDVADRVLAMEDYRARDVTREARTIAARYAAERRPEGGSAFGAITPRVPVKESFDASKGKRDVKISGRGTRTILFGRHAIDLGRVEGLVDPGQVAAIGQALHYAAGRYMDGNRALPEILRLVMKDIEEKGLDVIDRRRMGDYVLFRGLELAAALDRLPTLRVR